MVSPKLFAPNDLAACLVVRGLNLTCLPGIFFPSMARRTGFCEKHVAAKSSKAAKRVIVFLFNYCL